LTRHWTDPTARNGIVCYDRLSSGLAIGVVIYASRCWPVASGWYAVHATDRIINGFNSTCLTRTVVRIVGWRIVYETITPGRRAVGVAPVVPTGSPSVPAWSPGIPTGSPGIPTGSPGIPGVPSPAGTPSVPGIPAPRIISYTKSPTPAVKTVPTIPTPRVVVDQYSHTRSEKGIVVEHVDVERIVESNAAGWSVEATDTRRVVIVIIVLVKVIIVCVVVIGVARTVTAIVVVIIGSVEVIFVGIRIVVKVVVLSVAYGRKETEECDQPTGEVNGS
jgi:hypothetical protein